ncbi:hypothetical protein HYH03_006282 [Edaphochlamys debaryana]|uniref:SAM domain-containing protein n=1 Tax=Edaphochlamys debaryana TaxID=47281 RepID=A0A835Y5W0_9CHLO|nr:hypothetical protein HYH03_006282 [Edaphochlamys debaryana]|eukprot:KAG2495682.1 hypothetical protein HYH03_006282 [Edaphochlamys debaryana]
MGCGASTAATSSRENSASLGPHPQAVRVRARAGANPTSANGVVGGSPLSPGGPTASGLAAGVSGTPTPTRLGAGGSGMSGDRDTGATRSQMARGYAHLPLGLPLDEWDDEHVHLWLLTLPPALHQYTDTLCSPGGLLLQWTDELLAEAGVANAFHRKQLLEYVKQLKQDIAMRLAQQQLEGARDGARASGSLLPGAIPSPRAAGGSSGGGGSGGSAFGAARSGSGGAVPAVSGASGSGTEALGGRKASRKLELELDEPVGGRRPPSLRAGSASGVPEGSAEGGGKEDRKHIAQYEKGFWEEALGATRDVVRALGAMCPWPGDAAAELLAGLLDLSEKAAINRRNLQQLNQRAVDLLQLIANNKRLQADTHAYRNLMHRLMNTLKGIREYCVDFTNRNWLMRIVGSARDAHMFGQLWSALGALVADASLGLQVDAAGASEDAARALERLTKRQLQYDDEQSRLRAQIEAAGGVEAVVRDPGALAQLAASLGVGTQLTLHKIQEAVSLLEADRAEGVHSLIPHPDLRVLWRKCFSPRQDVAWALWWEAFPAELVRVPVEQRVVAVLSHRLTDGRRKLAFERRMEGSAPGRIGVVELRRHVPADADLAVVVAQLTERPSLDGSADLRGSTLLRPGARAAGSPSGATGGAHASDPTATSASSSVSSAFALLEPRCHLPPLDSDRFVGREEDVRAVADLLMAPPARPPRGQRDGSGAGDGEDRSSAGSRLGGGAGGGGGAPKPHAVCIIGESGQGKTALAVAAARRLWNAGALPGGAYYVDLAGADCRAELASRFAATLGVAKAEHDPGGGSSAVCLALQALAARGPLLLVLDGADCLDELYGIAEEGGLEAAGGEGEGDREPLLGEGGGVVVGSGGGADQDVQGALEELLAVVPSARVLLTAAEPTDLRGRAVEPFWLGCLPEQAAVALVQGLARCLSQDEARQLVSACGASPLVLRLAASAVAAGALTLKDTVSRARLANAASAAIAAASPSGAASGFGPGGGFGPAKAHSVAHPGGVGGAGSPKMLPTPRLQRSLSPVGPGPPSRFRAASSATAAVATAVNGGLVTTPTAAAGAGPSGQLPPGGFGFMSDPDDASAAAAAAAAAAGGGGAATLGSGAVSSSVRGSGRHRRSPSAIAKSMSFLLRTSGGTGSSGGATMLPLQPTYSGGGASSVGGRTLGAGAAVAAALLAGLSDEHRTALVQLSIVPGPFDEDMAASLLGQPPYAVRALLDVLLGFSVVVFRGGSVRGSYGVAHAAAGAGGGGMGGMYGGAGGVGWYGGCYSLTSGVLDAARSLLSDMDQDVRVELQCRFVGHVLALLMRADRLYGGGAVRAATQLASEMRQDVQALLLLAATCPDAERMLWRTIGPPCLPALAACPLFSALVLDASAEMEAFWRAVARQAAKAGDAAAGALAERALAQTLHRQARYLEAEGAWRGALASAARLSGPGSLEAAACHSGLGLALSAMGRHREAEEQHTAALNLRRAALGDQHADVAASLSNLARVMRNTGRYREAEAAYREALQVRTALLGEDHPDVADSLNAVGIVAGAQRRHLEEEQLYRKALAIRQRALGPDHPEVAMSLNNVGTALSSQGKYAAAEMAFRESLAIKRRVLGLNHHTVGTTLNNISRALRYQARLPEAEECCRQALAVLEAALGAAHPAVTTAVSNLIYMLKKQGKTEEAEAVYGAYKPQWAEGMGQLGDEALAHVVRSSRTASASKAPGGPAEAQPGPSAAPANGTHGADGKAAGSPGGKAAKAAPGAPGASGGGGPVAEGRTSASAPRLGSAANGPPGAPGPGANAAGHDPAAAKHGPGGKPPLAPLPHPQSHPGAGPLLPASKPPPAPPPPGLRRTNSSSAASGGSTAAAAAAAVTALGDNGVAAQAPGGVALLSRLDASAVLRQAMTEAARMAHADLQALEAAAKAKRAASGGGKGKPPSGPSAPAGKRPPADGARAPDARAGGPVAGVEAAANGDDVHWVNPRRGAGDQAKGPAPVVGGTRDSHGSSAGVAAAVGPRAGEALPRRPSTAGGDLGAGPRP